MKSSPAKTTSKSSPKVAAKAPRAKEAVKRTPAPRAASPRRTTPSQPAPLAHAVGRRKSSIARTWLRAGRGGFIVNGKEVATYFPTEVSLAAAVAPCAVLPDMFKTYDIDVNVIGGGYCSQADAVKLSIARAVIEIREEARQALKAEGLLRVDSRVKERKKYGQKGARRKFQFVKR